MPLQYPIRAAAKLTGLTIDTLRAWERRYNAVTPRRAERGRLYVDADIRRLLLLRSAVEAGHSIGHVAFLSDPELEDLGSMASPANGMHLPEVNPGAAVPALEPLVSAIKSYNSSAVNEELGRLALLLNPIEIVHKVVLPLMRLVGENGTFEIAQEHMLSACVRNLMGGLVRLPKHGNGGARLLLTTPSGELHEFGILAAAMLAVAHECQVTYLGPNLPAREILLATERSGPQTVVLGLMKINVTPAVCDELRWLAAELPPNIELWVGGSGAAMAVDPSLRTNSRIVEDLTSFEQHLARLKFLHSRGEIR